MTRHRCLRACPVVLLMMVGMELDAAESGILRFKASPVPGGVAVVPVRGKGPVPRVTYRGEPVLTRRTATGWQAVVGIPLDAKPGRHAVQVDGRAVAFTVKPKRYPTQRLRLKDTRKVTPNAEDQARIAKEQALIAPAWKARPEGVIPSLSFVQPTPGALTSSFGLRRVFNGKARSPHSGLDIRASEGQPISAPAAGVVVLTGEFFFTGHTVFLAHGEGVVSLFAHLSKINVTQGQAVKTGDLLGEVGSTGRSTGPHLHWSLSLNNARVDPRIFLIRHE